MEVPSLQVESELQLLAHTTAPVTPDLSCILDLHTARSNAGSLTHWARPGIEPTSSWTPVNFVTRCVTSGTPCLSSVSQPPRPQTWNPPNKCIALALPCLPNQLSSASFCPNSCCQSQTNKQTNKQRIYCRCPDAIISIPKDGAPTDHVLSAIVASVLSQN